MERKCRSRRKEEGGEKRDEKMRARERPRNFIFRVGRKGEMKDLQETADEDTSDFGQRGNVESPPFAWRPPTKRGS